MLSIKVAHKTVNPLKYTVGSIMKVLTCGTVNKVLTTGNPLYFQGGFNLGGFQISKDHL